MRILLMSSPAFGIPVLQTFLAAGHDVVAVVTQPDKPAGRGLRPTPPAMKVAAEAAGIPVLQPDNLSVPVVVEEMLALRADITLVAAYGKYIPAPIVDMAPLGCINLHPSLLPRWRGACPMAAAIRAGDDETGVTIHFVVDAMDAGDVLAQERTPIMEGENAGELGARLAELGAGVFLSAVEGWVRGDLKPWPQDHDRATWCDRLRKAEGRIDWTLPAVELERLVRAYQPWPGAYTEWRGQHLTVIKAAVAPGLDIEPGRVALLDGLAAIGTGDGALLPCQLQLAGRRPTGAVSFLCGARGFVGSTLGDETESGVGLSAGHGA